MKKLSIKEKFEANLYVAKQYRERQSEQKVIGHSVTDAVTKDGKQLAVSITELIASAKTAEILGYDTRLQVQNGGKSLAVLFVERIPLLPITLTF